MAKTCLYPLVALHRHSELAIRALLLGRHPLVKVDSLVVITSPLDHNLTIVELLHGIDGSSTLGTPHSLRITSIHIGQSRVIALAGVATRLLSLHVEEVVFEAGLVHLALLVLGHVIIALGQVALAQLIRVAEVA